jgi:hypothetical protein
MNWLRFSRFQRRDTVANGPLHSHWIRGGARLLRVNLVERLAMRLALPSELRPLLKGGVPENNSDASLPKISGAHRTRGKYAPIRLEFAACLTLAEHLETEAMH